MHSTHTAMLLASKIRRPWSLSVLCHYSQLHILTYGASRWKMQKEAEEKAEELSFILTSSLHLHSGIGSRLYPFDPCICWQIRLLLALLIPESAPLHGLMTAQLGALALHWRWRRCFAFTAPIRVYIRVADFVTSLKKSHNIVNRTSNRLYIPHGTTKTLPPAPIVEAQEKMVDFVKAWMQEWKQQHS